jgi:ribosome-binding factor A
MAAPRRILRLQQLILEVIAETLHREIQDPRIGLVTITRVQLSQDLSSAHVYWSMLGTETQRRTTDRGLRQALGLIQRRVAGAIGTRVTPTLTLRFDPTLEKAQRLNEIFERLRAERGEPPADPETAGVPGVPGAVGADDDDEDEDDLEPGEAIPPEDLPRDEDFEDEAE